MVKAYDSAVPPPLEFSLALMHEPLVVVHAIKTGSFADLRVCACVGACLCVYVWVHACVHSLGGFI